MSDLDSILRQHFGAARGGDRIVALAKAHALHESGYEVFYSRYSVSYRDATRAVDLPAEFDDEGDLVVHAAALEAPVRERLARALAFLGVTARFD